MMKRIKRYNKKKIHILFLFLLVMQGIKTMPESEPVSVFTPDTVKSKLSFFIDSLCMISDPYRTLDPFIAGLDSLRNGKDTVLTIVHLGDSHIQAGFLTGSLMRLLHKEYGNAGRGWIAPFKLSKTNEPDDYFLSSNISEWIAGKATQAAPKCPVGPGGIGIKSTAPSIRMNVAIAPKNGAGYQFNQAVLFRGSRTMTLEPTGKSTGQVDCYPGLLPVVPGVITDTFRIHCLADTLQLQSTRRIPGTGLVSPASDFENIYYGLILTNDNPGILYHSVGVNGAMFVNYTDINYVRQLALLKPSLLIISLGTNETFGRRFTESEFGSEVTGFIKLVREVMPGTAILLTTPPECYKRVTVNKQRTYVRNENTVKAARAIVGAAHASDVACLDLFEMTGGAGSSKNWFNGKWMGRDRIHFNKEGYIEQGVLFYKAINSLQSGAQEGDNEPITNSEE